MKGTHRATSPRSVRRKTGFTLVEAVVSILIVAEMLTAALGALGSAARGKRIQSARCLGANLARHLMAEVLQARYREPTDTPDFGPEAPEDGGCRAAWDDVDDYHGWNASPPQAKDGTPLACGAGWTRQVSVDLVRRSSPTTVAGSDEGLKRIVVTAVSPDGKPTRLSALRGEASICDRLPDSQTTYVSWIGVELQIGPDASTRVVSGTNVLNLVPASP